MTRSRRAVCTVAPALVAIPILAWLLLSPSPVTQLAAAPPEKTAAKDAFVDSVKPVFAKYCITCHNNKKVSGGMSLEPFSDTTSARKARDLWETVKEQIENRQMPPKGKPQPTDVERKAIVAWVDTVAIKVDCGLARDPGRPTIRRLNRTEYNNTIRDLTGVDFKPADNFPADDVGYGFDNIGDVLSMPPLLLEKYLAAAEAILDKAVPIAKPILLVKESVKPFSLRSTLGPLSKDNKRIALTQNGAATYSYDFLNEGDYILRARAYGDQAGKELPKLVIRLDKKDLKEHDVDALAAKPKLYEVKTRVTAGRHEIAAAFTNDFEDKEAEDKTRRDRNLYIEAIEIDGPFNPTPVPVPESQKRIMMAAAKTDADKPAAARTILEAFASKAYRRPVKPDELTRLLKLYQFAQDQKESFDQSVKHALKAVLVSPHFLFRIERDAEPNNPEAVHPIGQYELATRLSYFLWSTTPDYELFRLADKGELRNPGVIEAQVRRMLKDPKARSLVENFAGQWLMLRTLANMTPDPGTYKSFTPGIRDLMIRETELYFDHIMRDDRSVLEFLDSDYAFLNEKLAKYYGINGVSGSEFRKVKLTDKNRGGVITQGSVLTVTSNPTRTSPVKRGKWILENILGTPPPPPPPDVPELENDSKAVLTGTLRQRMEKHRENPSCATCHAKLDPLGFGLENFDGVGTFRQNDGKFKIDPSGVLPDGAKFSGPEELRKVLVSKADLFRRNLAEKMLTYALGRGLEYYDKCAQDDIVAAMKKGEDRFSTLMIAVVQSDPFQKRRGGSGKKE